MISIIRATEDDSFFLSQIAKQAFIESHGKSAPTEDIYEYISRNYNEETLRAEVRDKGNIYHFLYYNKDRVGYSKIILNQPYKGIEGNNIAKLERIFLLKNAYDMKLGLKLLTFNINFMKHQHQTGVWLYVWVENERAIKFYKRNGFEIIGHYDFKISENHTNPNYQMFLDFST